jgi:CPA2 family monovalent cation:H+ antiporter-2
LKSGLYPAQEIEKTRKDDHLVIIGFGVNGRNLALAARAGNIPYVIIEMNPEVVREQSAKGEAINFGDATQEAVLKYAGIKDARIVVVAINDPAATRRITELVHKLNPAVHLIVRTRYLQEMQPLHELGANEVIPEEFETSVEIFTRVLVKYLVPRDEIEKFIAEVRAGEYEIFRSLSKRSAALSDLKRHLPDVDICTLRVDDTSPVVGNTLAQIGLRQKYGVTLLAIRRDSQIMSNLHGDAKICAGDLLVVLGQTDEITAATRLFLNPHKGESIS